MLSDVALFQLTSTRILFWVNYKIRNHRKSRLKSIHYIVMNTGDDLRYILRTVPPIK